MKKTVKIASIIVISMLVSQAGILATVAAEAQVPVSINAPDIVGPGSNFTATIDIGGVVDLNGAQYDISFDPSVLRLDDVTAGEIDGTEIPVDIWNEISPGTYTIVQNVPGLEGVSGSGYLAVLHFRVKGSSGTSTSITLQNGWLSDKEAKQIIAQWIGDLVNVS